MRTYDPCESLRTPKKRPATVLPPARTTSIAAVEGKVPDGGAVEVVLAGGKTVAGRFFGVRNDSQGSYVLIEVESSGGSRFRAFRDFIELRTPGYKKGELQSGSDLVYAAPDK